MNLNGISLRIGKQERVSFRKLLDHAPYVSFDLQGFQFEAMILCPVTTDDLTSWGAPHPWKSFAIGLGQPTAVGMNKAVLTRFLVAKALNKSLDDAWLDGFGMRARLWMRNFRRIWLWWNILKGRIAFGLDRGLGDGFS